MLACGSAKLADYVMDCCLKANFQIDLPVTPKAVYCLVAYLYTGSTQGITPIIVPEMAFIAKEWQLKVLAEMCENMGGSKEKAESVSSIKQEPVFQDEGDMDWSNWLSDDSSFLTHKQAQHEIKSEQSENENADLDFDFSSASTIFESDSPQLKKEKPSIVRKDVGKSKLKKIASFEKELAFVTQGQATPQNDANNSKKKIDSFEKELTFMPQDQATLSGADDEESTDDQNNSLSIDEKLSSSLTNHDVPLDLTPTSGSCTMSDNVPMCLLGCTCEKHPKVEAGVPVCAPGCTCDKHKPYICSCCHKGEATITKCVAHIAKEHFQEIKGKNCREFVINYYPYRKTRNPEKNAHLRKCDVEGCKYYDSSIRSVYYHKYWQHKMDIPHWLILYTCPYCQKEFRTNLSFWNHVSIHTSEVNARTKLCEECGKAFKTNQLLRWHVERHHFPAPIRQCPVCTKTFRSHSNMDVHMRIHMDYRPFKCRYCMTYESNTRGAIFAHLRTQHQGCDEKEGIIIDEKFARPGRHWQRKKMKSRASSKTSTVNNLCHECGQSFNSIYLLQTHVSVDHPSVT